MVQLSAGGDRVETPTEAAGEYEVPILTVTYAGPALEDGGMDAAMFGSSLAALAEGLRIFSELQLRLRVRPRIIGAPRRGTFHFDLGPPRDIQDLAAWSAVVGGFLKYIAVPGARSGYRQLLRWVRGDEQYLDPKSLLSDREFGTGVDATLADDRRFVRKLKSFSAPLTKRGIHEIRAGRDGRQEAVITKQDALDTAKLEVRLEDASIAYRNLPPSADEWESDLEIVRCSFSPRETWTLRETSGQFDAQVLDEKFFRRIDELGLKFGKGDRLRARVRRLDWYGKNAGSSYQVVRVESYHPADKRLPAIAF